MKSKVNQCPMSDVQCPISNCNGHWKSVIGHLKLDFEVNLELYHSINWIEIRVPSNKDVVKEYMITLDVGEAEAITLAKELDANFLLIDERLGTKLEKEKGRMNSAQPDPTPLKLCRVTPA